LEGFQSHALVNVPLFGNKTTDGVSHNSVGFELWE
jgi:hypothetical protein